MSTQVIPVPLQGFGRRGINYRDRFQILDPSWLTQATNVWFNPQGLLETRPCQRALTTSAVAATPLRRVFAALNPSTGATSVYAASDTNFYLAGDTTVTKNTGTAVSAGYWKFLNFNAKAYAFQAGQTPKVCATIGGTWADLTAVSGTIPTGDAFTAAFGRIWGVNSDGRTIKYCALLDPTDWGGSDTGSIDMGSIFGPLGDRVVAIDQMGSSLIVFGADNIVIWEDGAGSSIGIDPTQMAVVDVIRGIGCIYRDTVQAVTNGDLWFLSRRGVRSLARSIQQKNNPLGSVSKYIDDAMRHHFPATAPVAGSLVTAAYVPDLNLYILASGGISGSQSGQWVFHVERAYTDEEGDLVAPATFWLLPNCAAVAYDPKEWNLLSCSNGSGAYVWQVYFAGLNADESGTSGNQPMTARIYSARIAPQRGRLVASKGLRVQLRHTGSVTLEVAAAGSLDTPLPTAPSGTYWTALKNINYITDSTGTAVTESDVQWGSTYGVSTFYYEEMTFEMGGEGEWMQFAINAFSTSAASGYLLGFTDITAYFEIDRGI